ncbi:nuclear localization sequence-binding protein-like [Nicotiana sylvestris]|uniref:nuclear localization sequence-binding protein-like n=1 Tax=Nicotiana sylvestris TaxID=4096 RepID=UPI00388C6285
MKKRTKKKKAKKMPKKKSKVKFKHAQNNSKKSTVSRSTSKQNDQSLAEIKDSIQIHEDQKALDVQDEGKQNSSTGNGRIEGLEKEKAPNIQMEEGNQSSQDKETNRKEESKAEKNNKHAHSNSNTSTVPTEIRNLSGINLVVDLDGKEWEYEVNESSINRFDKNAKRGSDTENEDIDEVTES